MKCLFEGSGRIHSLLRAGGWLPLFASMVAWGQSPVYFNTLSDAVTGNNSFTAADGKRYWTISPGADSYQNDIYERPTVQTYQVRTLADSSERFAANEYYQNVDIAGAKVGFDATFLYVSINLFGLNKSTEDGVNTFEGLKYRYGFRMSLAADGANGFMFLSEDPLAKHGTTFGLTANSGYADTDGSVGGSGAANGLSITKEDDALAAQGNGFDLTRISDGVIQNGANTGSQALFARIDPSSPTTVEFALNYGLLGFSAADLLNLAYFEVEAIKGNPKDPQNYLWNDEYTKSEAGSPYRANTGTLSEFGTQGLVSIHELDTMRLTIPEPNSISLMMLGLLALVAGARRKRVRPSA